MDDFWSTHLVCELLSWFIISFKWKVLIWILKHSGLSEVRTGSSSCVRLRFIVLRAARVCTSSPSKPSFCRSAVFGSLKAFFDTAVRLSAYFVFCWFSVFQTVRRVQVTHTHTQVCVLHLQPNWHQRKPLKWKFALHNKKSGVFFSACSLRGPHTLSVISYHMTHSFSVR